MFMIKSCTHAAILRFPVVVGGVRDIVLSTDILNFETGICLIEDRDNLCFGESRFFHLSLLVCALCQKALLLKCKLLGEAYEAFLSCIMQNAKFEMEELWAFRRDTQDLVFIVDDDIPNYIKEIGNKAFDMQTTIEELKDVPVGSDRSLLVEKKSELFRWLVDQLPKLKKVFTL